MSARDLLHVEIGRRIRELRKKKGLLQEELARKSGLSASALSNFEQGRRRASLAWLGRIARSLGVPVPDLIPQSRARPPLAESPEEEALLTAWRSLSGDPLLQDETLDFIERLAKRLSSLSSRSRST